MAAEFELYQDRAGEYRWRLQANNNEIVAESSDGYASKAGCLNAIEVVRRVASEAPVHDLEGGSAGRKPKALAPEPLAVAVEAFFRVWTEESEALQLSLDDKRIADAIAEMAMEVVKTDDPPKALLREGFRWIASKVDIFATDFASSAGKTAGIAAGAGMAMAASGQMPRIAHAAARVLDLLN